MYKEVKFHDQKVEIYDLFFRSIIFNKDLFYKYKHQRSKISRPESRNI